MAKKKKKQEHNEVLAQVSYNFTKAKAELETRVTHKTQGFDEYDNLYRSHINKDKWPFNSRIFIPLSFTSLFAKGTRLITGKMKGKMSATQYGSELGARIGTELLSAQYDDHDFYFDEPLISKWLRMDQNARKYGAGFALVGWKNESRGDGVEFDGPTFEVLDNRKVYLQAGVHSISDADYVIVEREATLGQLEAHNKAAEKAGKEPVYRNLDRLKEKKEHTITRQFESRNASIRGLDDRRSGKGQDAPFRLLTEYRKDRWITWTPDVGGDEQLGTVLREIGNPYKHGLIPIIRLVYIPIDDDSYGLSELEAGRSLQKASNALVSGFVEAVSTELYPIIKGHPTNVDWNTVRFKPRAAWIMNNPTQDLIRMDGAFTFTRNFVEAYKLLVSQFAESVGDTTSEASQLAALSSDKTATEVRDLALKRGARDNLNKIFLAAAVTKMYTMWWAMNQQFLSQEKVIAVAGKDAIEYFVNEGLNGFTLTDEGYNHIKLFMEEQNELGIPVDFETAYEILRIEGDLEQYAVPLYPTKQGSEIVPKLQLNRDGKSGFLAVNGEDITGQYRFVFDLNTLGEPNEQQEATAMNAFLDKLKEFEQQLGSEGYKVKYKELLEDVAEKVKLRNADQYFEKIDPEEVQSSQQPMGGGVPQGAPMVQPQDLMAGQMDVNQQGTAI